MNQFASLRRRARAALLAAALAGGFSRCNSGTEPKIESLAAPAAPTALSASPVSSEQITLAWTDNASDESGFHVERAPGATTTFAEIAAVGANVTAYESHGLSGGTSYSYRVRAYNSSGNSSYSNTVSATAQAALAINLSPTTVAFTTTTGSSNPAPLTVSVASSGGGTVSGLTRSVSYTAGQPSNWLTTTLLGTTTPTTLTLQPTGSLAVGTYTASVSVSSPVASNSPRTVTVT